MPHPPIMNDVQSILDKQESFVIKSINHLHIDYLTTNYGI